ncbi:hypothetical protein PT974_12091 [Cladobotryum mycophilum]|uniref:Uncharacterized protein n=1 Tax=Cladobotryum mycophilum TaxID=491253 RepID=A0ABR0S725_9HYPO
MTSEQSIFPGTTSITEGPSRSYLNFGVSEMPKTPWPLTIGGVPVTLSDGTHGRCQIFPLKGLGNLSISICTQTDARQDSFSDSDLRLLARQVVRELSHIKILELIFTFDKAFHIVLDGQVLSGLMRARLPDRIAKCPVGYILSKDLCRPIWVDDGSRSPIQCEVVAESPRDPCGRMKNTLVSLDNHDIGCRDGMTMATSIRLETEIDPYNLEDTQLHVAYNWIYMGQVEGTPMTERWQPPDNIHGSIIRDGGDAPTGYFQYYISTGDYAGFLVSIQADEV